MVKIRLKRMGKKRHPFYRIIVADALAPRDGKFIEQVGYYDPISKDLNIKEDLVMKWLHNGAQPTETVKTLFKKLKINEKYDKSKKTTKKD